MRNSLRQTTATDLEVDPPNSDTRRLGLLIPMWASSLALLCLLYLIYAPAFTMDYLTLDEVGFVGRDAGTFNYSYHALAHGRPLAFYRPLVYLFAGYDPVRIQLVRFVFFVSMAAIAIFLFRFLYRESGRLILSFFTTLFLFSQLTFQTISGFSLDLISFVVPPMCLSLAAFWLHCYVFPRRGIRKWKANGAVLVLLVAAMQSGQVWAFLGMVPLSFLVLTGRRERVRQARTFILLAMVSIVLSVLAFEVGLEALRRDGRSGYAVGERTMAAMISSPWELVGHGINPQTYWSAFKLWSYPFPFHNTPPSIKRREILAVTVLIAWLGLVIGAIATELRARDAEKRLIVAKWLAAGACLGFGALVLVAESPLQTHESRPHLTLVMSGVSILVGSYALLVLSSRFKVLQTNTARAVGMALVLMTAFGAQTSLLRGYVDNRGDQLDFIRTELSAKRSADFDTVVVVFPPRTSICISEPCDEYSGQVTHRFWHARRPERYRYAMKTIGIPPKSKRIIFVDDYSRNRDRDLVIDWRKFFRARKRYARSLALG